MAMVRALEHNFYWMKITDIWSIWNQPFTNLDF